ncbi:hypothetical protein V6N13_116046 [Hibiscus sabdariffa]
MFDFPFGFGGLCWGMRGGDKLRVLTAVVIPNYSVACAVAYYGALLLAPPRSSSSQNFSKAQAYLCLAGALFLPVCDDRLPPFLGFPLALCNLYGCGASPLFIVLTPLLSTMGVIALFCVIRPSVLHLGFRRKGTGLGFLSHSVCLPAIGAADANLGCLSSCTCLLMRAAAAHAFHYVGVLSQLPALVPRGRASRATVVTIFGPPSVPARWFPFPSLGLCSSWAGLYASTDRISSANTTPSVPVAPAPSMAAPKSALPTSPLADQEPYDPMLHADTSNLLEESLDILSDYSIPLDIDGIAPPIGEDLLHLAIDEVADSLMWEVASSILAQGHPASVGSPAQPVAMGSTASSEG